MDRTYYSRLLIKQYYNKTKAKNTVELLVGDNVDLYNNIISKINDTLNKILDAKFDINPKYNKGNIGCEFCKYKDLCFMKEYDFKKIESSDIFDE